jgi:ATP-dependent DNA ligase, homolog of eukaryotic ligase III
MSDAFFRFPRTPHVAWLGEGAPRDDKLLSSGEVHALLDGPVVVEEKLDGANLGFSLAPDGRLRAQNRGHYLTEPHAGQFQRLHDWIARHGERLGSFLGDNLIAFGEWCAARHSLDYPALPDWWLLFDVYDRREKKFWSTNRRDALAHELRLVSVPRISEGKQTAESLKRLVADSRSRYRNGVLEGVVVRREDRDWLRSRAKLVRADFTQVIDSHWRSRKLEWNRIDWSSAALLDQPQ